MSASLTSSTLTLGSRQYTDGMFAGLSVSKDQLRLSGDIGTVSCGQFSASTGSLTSGTSKTYKVTASSGTWAGLTLSNSLGGVNQVNGSLGASFSITAYYSRWTSDGATETTSRPGGIFIRVS